MPESHAYRNRKSGGRCSINAVTVVARPQLIVKLHMIVLEVHVVVAATAAAVVFVTVGLDFSHLRQKNVTSKRNLRVTFCHIIRARMNAGQSEMLA